MHLTEPLRGHVPRLDVLGAVAGGTTAFLAAEVARTGIYAIDLRLLALVVGLIAGAVVGWTIRFSLATEPDEASPRRRWLAPLAAWLAAGISTSAIVVVGGNWFIFGRVGLWVFEGIGFGALCTVASMPACLWLTARARSARRARCGSLVASADVRAIVGALLASLSLQTLALVPRWRDAFFGQAQVPMAALVIALGAGLVGALLLLADMWATRSARRLVLTVADLDEADGGAETPVAGTTDVGLGDELFVEDTPGQTYRAGRTVVPLVRGAPDVAAYALQRSVTSSSLRLGLLLIPIAIHTYAATATPEPQHDKEVVQIATDHRTGHPDP